MEKIETCLLLLKKDNKLLMSEKKRGFGQGKLVNIGGKLKNGESPEEAIIRETKEEVNIDLTNIEKIGKINFVEYYKGVQENVIMHIFEGKEFGGNLIESDEVKPLWIDCDNIPYEKMLPDNKFWFPIVLEGNKIEAEFDFDENWNLLRQEIILI